MADGVLAACLAAVQTLELEIMSDTAALKAKKAQLATLKAAIRPPRARGSLAKGEAKRLLFKATGLFYQSEVRDPEAPRFMRDRAPK